MRERHLSCREIVELVTDYQERALDSETAAAFEEHINFCDGCEAYLQQMRATVAALAQLADQPVPNEARRRLLDAFRAWRQA